MRVPWPATFCALAVAAGAVAIDRPIAGDLLVLRDPPHGTGAMRFRVRRDAVLEPAASEDPRTVGATLEVAGGAAGDGSTDVIPLDAAHWKGLGKPPGSRGYRWRDSRRPSGVARVVFRGGTLVVRAGGAGWPYVVTQPQGPIDVRFAVGDDVYCAKFESFVENRPGRVIARRAAAPADCTPGEPAVCGNGRLEEGEECDDGNAAAGDGCSSGCQLENASALCAGVPTVAGTGIRAARIAAGLAQPVQVTAAPLDPNRLFLVEQPGRIRVLRNRRLMTTPYLDVSGKVVRGDERGLLSVAFHPDFERTGFLYVNYTRAPDGATVVARYHADPAADQAEAGSENVLFTIPQPFANHNGGLNLFGPDGFLWVGMGDGGGAGDPGKRAQNDGVLLGKLLRVDLATGQPTIFAKGLRNPWRFSFDRATGDLYIGDVGQDDWEEVDVQPAPLVPGVNYGWDFMEGDHCFEPGTGCPTSGLTRPVLEYCHDQNLPECAAHPRGCSITGGFVYRGCQMPDLAGRYFYADFCSAFIASFRGLAADDVRNHTAELVPGGGLLIDHVSSFGEDARGELYVVDYGNTESDGEVYAIVPR